MKIYILIIKIVLIAGNLDFQTQFPKLFHGKNNGYLTIQQTKQLVDYWQKNTSDIVPFHTVGYSFKNNPIQIFGLTKIQNKQLQNLKKYPAILINSLLHPRQKGSLTLLLSTLLYIQSLAQKSQQINFLLESCVIWFLPFPNIDPVITMQKIWNEGYKRLDSKVQFRKNQNNTNSEKVCSRLIDQGIDLNRNFDVNWKYKNVPPCSQQYSGSKPFSQNQTITIKSIYQQFNIVMGLDFHCYGNSWIYPYTYDMDEEVLKQEQINYRFYQKLIKQLQFQNITINTCQKSLGYITEYGVYIDWALSKGTFALVYQVGKSFFNDQFLRSSIENSLKGIQIVLLRNSYKFDVVCMDKKPQQYLNQIGFQSLSTIPIQIRIQQFAYWRYVHQQQKHYDKIFILKGMQQIIIGVSQHQSQFVIQMRSSTNGFYTKNINILSGLKGCSMVFKQKSHIIRNFLIISALVLVFFCLFVLIKNKKNIFLRIKTSSPSQITQLRQQTIDRQNGISLEQVNKLQSTV